MVQETPYGQQPPMGGPGYGGQMPGPYGQPPRKSHTGLIIGLVVLALVVVGGGIGAFLLLSGDDSDDDDDSGGGKKSDKSVESQLEAALDDYMNALKDSDADALADAVCEDSKEHADDAVSEQEVISLDYEMTGTTKNEEGYELEVKVDAKLADPMTGENQDLNETVTFQAVDEDGWKICPTSGGPTESPEPTDDSDSIPTRPSRD